MTHFFELQNRIAEALSNNYSPQPISENSTAQLSFDQSLAIYRKSKQAQLAAVLAEIYPVCQKIVGADFFHGMTQLYINQTPSVSPNINEYGESFPQFIASFAPAQTLVYLTDVARLEWLWHRLAMGQDYQALAVAELMQVKAEDYAQLQFSLPKNSYLFFSDYPVQEIWEFNQTDQKEMLDLDQLPPAKLFLWRPQWLPVITPVDELQWAVLLAIQQGKTVEQLCEQFSADDIPTLLGEFVSQGWVNQFC